MDMLGTRPRFRSVSEAGTYRNSKASGHPVQVIGVLAHRRHVRNDRLLGPLDPENLSKFLEIESRSFSDRVHCIGKPAQTQIVKLFIEECDAQLTG